MLKPIVKWISPRPEKCQWCNDELTAAKVFYDARTPQGWAVICRRCFVDLGCRLGTGLGQEFDNNTLNKLRG